MPKDPLKWVRTCVRVQVRLGVCACMCVSVSSCICVCVCVSLILYFCCFTWIHVFHLFFTRQSLSIRSLTFFLVLINFFPVLSHPHSYSHHIFYVPLFLPPPFLISRHHHFIHRWHTFESSIKVCNMRIRWRGR